MASIEEIVRRIVREEVRAALEDCRTPAVQPGSTDQHLLTTEAAAELVGAAPQTLRNWRTVRKGPPAVKVGRLVKYRREDVEQWIEERATPVAPTAASSANGSAPRP